MQRMDFLPLEATVPQEEDPLAVMLNFSGLANAQANMIRVDDLDSIDGMGIETLEDHDTKGLATTFNILAATTRISFRIDSTKILIRMVHWVQDYEYVSMMASVVSGTTQL